MAFFVDRQYDTKLYYEIVREGEPFLLIHGWAIDHFFLMNALEPAFKMSGRSFKRIYVDVPGMGQSEPGLVRNGDGVVDVLIHLMDEICPGERFCIGGNSFGAKLSRAILAKHPDRIREIYDAGHEIGNHTWSHGNLTRLGRDRIREEVRKTEEVLMRICGEKPAVFRPPGGCWSESSIAVVEEMGYTCVLWSVDTRDWTMPGADSVIRRVAGKTRGGDIVLFHDLGDEKLPTPDALRVLLPQLREEGYEFVTVSELLGANREAVS